MLVRGPLLAGRGQGSATSAGATMSRQRTLRRAVATQGVGLHSGAQVQLRLRPAPADSGIVFRRTDLACAVDIPACVEYVADTRLSTTLERNGVRVATVEHLLAAFSGLAVDNALVELTADEVPIKDGSAAPFVELLQRAGIEIQAASRNYLRILQPLRVEQGDKWAQLQPHDGFRLSFSIEYDHPAFDHGMASASYDRARDCFAIDFSRARTFGFMHEAEQLRSAGLVRGASTANAIVVDDRRVLNEEGLRYEDEFVRHKILDAMGDLALLGFPLLGEFRAHKSGHALNNALLRKLRAQPQSWELVTFETAAQEAFELAWSPG